MAFTQKQQEIIDAVRAGLDSVPAKERPKKEPWRPMVSSHPLFGIPPMSNETQEAVMRYAVPAGATLVNPASMPIRLGIQALAGAAGEQMAQESEIQRGARNKREIGAVAASSLMNLAPGGGVFRTAGQNVLAETARSVIDEGRLPSWKEAGLAGLVGGGAGATGRLTSSRVLSESDSLLKKRSESFQKMRKHGFKLNPNDLKETGLLNWIAGDAPLDVAISRNNQVAAQKLARKAIGAKPGEEFRMPEYEPTGAVKRPGELDELLFEAEAPYRKVRAISEAASEGRGVQGLSSEQRKLLASAESALDEMKVVRRDASRAWQARNTDPEAYGRYEALKAREAVLDKHIEDAAALSQADGLLAELKEARHRIARIHVVKNATSPEDGVFNMQELPKMREAGIRLTDDLQDLEEFAFHFDRASLNPRQSARDAPSNINMPVMFRQAGQASPAAGGGFLGPIAGKRARSLIMSPAYQRLGVGPIKQKTPNILSQAAMLGVAEQGRGEQLAISEILRRAGLAGN